MLASSTALALSPSLCWHYCPHCAGVAALVVLALLPLLRWCCCCLLHGLPRRSRLSTCQLNKGKDACKLTARHKHSKGKEGCTRRALMPAPWGQQQQRDKGKITNAMAQWGQQHWCNDADYARATWGQRGQRNKDNNANATRATMPVQCRQWHQRNDGNNTIMTMAKASAHWQLWQCQCDKGDDASLTMAAK